MKIMFSVQNISIYNEFRGVRVATYMVHCTFVVYYAVHRTFVVYYCCLKVQEHYLYLNQILHHFDLNLFS